MVDALVLAGSLNEGALSRCSTVRYEALIPIGKKSMVEYVVDALLDSDRINRIVVVGPKEELTGKFSGKNVKVIKPKDNLVDNVVCGLKLLPGAQQVLVVTSDIPLINSKAVNNFLDQCKDYDADLYYPIVPREVVEKRFSSSNRTYVNLKEGVFTGGNVFLLNPNVVWRCLPKGQEIVNARKSPLKLCRLVGFMFLIRYLMRSVTLEKAQRKVSRLLGIRGRVVVSMDPELGIDVDKPSDLDLVNKKLGIAR
jgi:GTP:adenosylcobinamide-phosphate guanylyltransferase